MDEVKEWAILKSSTQIADIKKAYAQLLKMYHPEDDPDGFKKVQSFYKRAIQRAKTAQISSEVTSENNEQVASFLFFDEKEKGNNCLQSTDDEVTYKSETRKEHEGITSTNDITHERDEKRHDPANRTDESNLSQTHTFTDLDGTTNQMFQSLEVESDEPFNPFLFQEDKKQPIDFQDIFADDSVVYQSDYEKLLLEFVNTYKLPIVLERIRELDKEKLYLAFEEEVAGQKVNLLLFVYVFQKYSWLLDDLQYHAKIHQCLIEMAHAIEDVVEYDLVIQLFDLLHFNKASDMFSIENGKASERVLNEWVSIYIKVLPIVLTYNVIEETLHEIDRINLTKHSESFYSLMRELKKHQVTLSNEQRKELVVLLNEKSFTFEEKEALKEAFDLNKSSIKRRYYWGGIILLLPVVIRVFLYVGSQNNVPPIKNEFRQVISQINQQKKEEMDKLVQERIDFGKYLGEYSVKKEVNGYSIVSKEGVILGNLNQADVFEKAIFLIQDSDNNWGIFHAETGETVPLAYKKVAVVTVVDESGHMKKNYLLGLEDNGQHFILEETGKKVWPAVVDEVTPDKLFKIKDGNAVEME